jgi:flagellar basal body-associated protein FliL
MGWIILIIIIAVFLLSAMASMASLAGGRDDETPEKDPARIEAEDDETLIDWYASQELPDDLDDWNR